MKKTMKKVISLVLVLVMLMSTFAAFASAEDATVEEPAAEEHGTIFGVFMQMFMEFYGLLKYIFYDVWRGIPPV